MSSTTLHGFRGDGEICYVNSYSNAFWGAYLVWLEMGEKYGIKDVELICLNEAKSKEVWALGHDPKVSDADRITMITTFDRCVVYDKDFNRLITALRESAKWLPPHCHIAKQADDIEKIKQHPVAETPSSFDIIAVGWTQTSVSYAWSSKETHIIKETDPDNGRREEFEEEMPYNLYRHKLHFDLFEEYDEYFNNLK